MTTKTIESGINFQRSLPWGASEKVVWRGYALCYRLEKGDQHDNVQIWIPGGRTVQWSEIKREAQAPAVWRRVDA